MIRWISFLGLVFFLPVDLLANKIELNVVQQSSTPVELRILVDSYNHIIRDDIVKDKKSKQHMTNMMRKLDGVLGVLEPKTEFLLIKNHIYQAIIEFFSSINNERELKSKEVLAIADFLRQNSGELLPLAQWLGQSSLAVLKNPLPAPVVNARLASKAAIERQLLSKGIKLFISKDVARINGIFVHIVWAVVSILQQKLSLFLAHSKDLRRPKKVSWLKFSAASAAKSSVPTKPKDSGQEAKDKEKQQAGQPK